jgi:proteasome accessory factor C
MLTLVPWLLARPGVTVAEIAEAFATSEEVILEELDHLGYCGLPGLHGGDLIEVSIIDDTVVVRMADELRRPMRTSPAETMRLLLAASQVERMLGPGAEALTRAVAKLRTALGVPAGAVAVVDPEPGDLVEGLRRAIADGRRVVLTYRGRGEDRPTARQLDPWRLELLDGAWYLHAHDHGTGATRILRLDRAADLEVTTEPSTVPAPDVLESPRYVPGPDDPEVEVLLAPAGAWLLDAVEVAPGATLEGPGGRSARFRVGAPEWFARLVLMAGGHAEVRGPDGVRDLVRDRARAGLARLAAGDADGGAGTPGA